MVPMAPSTTCTRPSAIRSARVFTCLPLVVQVGRKPSLCGGHVHTLASRVILHLISLDLADAEILRLWMPEVVAAHGGSREHGEALGQCDAGPLLGAEQVEENSLLGM